MNELSDKEIQFLKLACQDKTYKEIGDEMYISHRTVDGYRDRIFRKFNVKSRVGLLLYAIKNELIII